jgi:uncharacterized C2H2 Zn-finger protein
MENNSRKILTCKKCNWIWVQRKQFTYKCPKCHSYEWDKDENYKNKFLSELEKEKNQSENTDILKETEIKIKDKPFTEKEIRELIKKLAEMI